jgi:hypothetical protein
MVDILREFQPALDWLESLDEAPGLPGFVVMELMDGCRNKQEMNKLQKQAEPFRLYWPREADCNRATVDFAQGHLSHNLGLLDAIIGHTSVGLEATLCTFNTRHFRAVSDLLTEPPYVRNTGLIGDSHS